MPKYATEKVLDRATAVTRDVVAPAAASIDEDATWPEEGLRALLDAELGGLVVPEDAGGLGHGLAALAAVCEIIATECASTAMCFGMHGVGSAVLAAKATDEQRVRYLEPIAMGAHITTLTVSEPGTGAHFWMPQTELRTVSPEDGGPDDGGADDDDRGYVVNGTKTFVTSGGHADSYVVSAVGGTGPGTGTVPRAGDFSCVVIDRDAPGVEWGPPWDGLGMRGNSSRSVELRDVVVPRSALLGQPGDQIWYVFNVIAPYFLVAMAGTYLGVGAGAFEDMRLHVTQRRHSHTGSRLAEQHVVQHRVGTMWAQLERTRQLVRSAAEAADRDDPDALPALTSAKAEVAECATDLVNDAMTMVGGIGYREHGTLGRRLRDARAAHVMSPTTDLLRLWTGRAVLGEHLLAD